jgi:hypothetical protein
MNEVDIPLKISGIGAIKAELKGLKGEIANATDPKDIQRLSQAAGALSDRIKDANEAVANFSTGSAFESARNNISGIGDSLANLDFEEAGQKMQSFAGYLSTIKPDAITKGLGAMTKGVGALSAQFLKMGASLLVNPIFIIGAVIAAIVAIVLVVLNKFGVLTKIIDAMAVPLKYIISLFEDLTDWLGLTSNAADENADKIVAANARVQESSKQRGDIVAAAYDFEIAMAKIAGKDTTKLELDKSLNKGVEARNRINGNKKELKALYYDDSDEAMKRKKELIKANSAENAIIAASRNERKIIRAQDRKDSIDDAKKQSEDAARAGAEAAKAAAERRKQEKANRLSAARLLRDLEIAVMQEGADKEIAVINQKYKIMREDLALDATKTAAEKKAIDDYYAKQREADLQKSATDRAKIESDNFKAGQQMISDLTLASMEEGTAKELAQQKDKYAKLRKGVMDNITLTEIQKAELIAIYNEQELAESQKTIAEKAKATNDLIFELTATAKDKELQALKEKYDAQLLIAGENAEAQKALTEGLEKSKAEIENKYTLEKIATAEKERQAKLQVATEVVNGIAALGNAFIKDQKKLEKFNKAAALIQIGIDTAKAISSLVSMSQANPLNSVTFGAAGIAQFASGVVQIVTNIAKAKQLLSNPASSVSGGGGGGGGGGDTSTNSTTPATPAVSLFGQGNNANSMGSPTSVETGGNMTVTAVVSETQITNVQNKINKINKNAEL